MHIKTNSSICVFLFVNFIKKICKFCVDLYPFKSNFYKKLINKQVSEEFLIKSEKQQIEKKNVDHTFSNCYCESMYSRHLAIPNGKLELQSASNFLVHLIKLGRRNLNENQLEKFRLALVEVLRRRYRDHWFPEKPFKGSGYRCIRINGKMDPVIAQAGESCGLQAALIHSTFPSELTVWIDPFEVSYRIGENGSICVLYEHQEGVDEPWKPGVSSSKNCNTCRKNLISTKNFNNSTNIAETSAIVPSKDSLRKMDYLLDPRKSVSIEQLAAYIYT